MYTGTLIDDLIATVERAETSICAELEPESNIDNWLAIAPAELLGLEAAPQFAGVA